MVPGCQKCVLLAAEIDKLTKALADSERMRASAEWSCTPNQLLRSSESGVRRERDEAIRLRAIDAKAFSNERARLLDIQLQLESQYVAECLRSPVNIALVRQRSLRGLSAELI